MAPTCSSRRSWSPASGCPKSWRTAGTTGYDALALIDRVLTDPAGEAPLGALEDRLRGAPVDWSRDDPRHQARRRGHHAAGRDPADRPRRLAPGAAGNGRARGRRGRAAGLHPGLPLLPPRGSRARRRRLRGRAPAPARPRRRARRARAGLRRRRGRGDPALPADQRHGHGQGRRGPGVLPLGATHLPQRGRRRPVGVRGGARRLPRRDGGAPGRAWPARDDRRLHPRHQARARTSGPGSPSWPRRPNLWADALDRLLDLASLPDRGFGNLLWQAVVGVWSDDPALRDRLHAYAEKAMREAGDRTTWTDPDEAYETAVHAAVDAAFDDERVSAVLDEVLTSIADAGWCNALAAKLIGLTVPRSPRRLPGLRALGAEPGRPGQPPAGRLRRPRRPARRRGPPSQAAARPRGAAAASRPARAVHVVRRGRLPRGEAADHVLAFDRGGAVTVATRLPLGLADRGGWGDTTARAARRPLARPADRRTSSPATAAVAVAELLTELPVALLVSRARAAPRTRGRFDVWAPLPERVRLSVGGGDEQRVVEMTRGAGDWWRPGGPAPEGEVDYGYLLDDAETPGPRPALAAATRRRPRPVAHLRPDRVRVDRPRGGTGGPSPAARSTSSTSGPSPPRARSTPRSGSSTTSVEIGVDFVELMPVNAFNGPHGWGYDGVLWSAASTSRTADRRPTSGSSTPATPTVSA